VLVLAPVHPLLQVFNAKSLLLATSIATIVA